MRLVAFILKEVKKMDRKTEKERNRTRLAGGTPTDRADWPRPSLARIEAQTMPTNQSGASLSFFIHLSGFFYSQLVMKYFVVTVSVFAVGRFHLDRVVHLQRLKRKIFKKTILIDY